MTHRPTSSTFRKIAVGASALAVAGILFACGGGGGSRLAKGGVEPGPSKPPPSFPAPRDVPVDQSLVAAAKAELTKLLQSDTPSVRAHAIEAYRDALPDEAAGPILSQIDVPSQIVRFAAAMAAGDLKLAAAKPKLLEHLRDPDPKVRVAVLYALHQLGDKSRSNQLEKTATDFSAEGAKVRGATALVLGRLNEPTVGNILRTLAADEEPMVREQAQEALFLRGDENARNTILAYSISPPHAMLALMALAQAKEPRYRQYARAQLTNDLSPEIGLVAARAMGEMDADDGYGVAMAGAKSGDWRQASLAALAFGAIGRTDAQPILTNLLQDKNEEVRAAAATAILRIARHPKRYSRSGDLLR